MKSRCNNPKVPSYPRYGGRGIAVCERWSKSYEAFLEDMGRRPALGYSLDRYPNNDGNYEPGNCRWATAIEQQNNRSSNVWITANGETRDMSQWARHLGVTVGAIAERITRGYSPEQAVTTPFNRGLAGSLNGNAKLTEEDVRSIRLMHKHGYKPKRLRILFGMTRGGMDSVLGGRLWKNV